MKDTDTTVFVVDDEPSVRRALVRLLKSAGFRAEGCATAEEYLARPASEVPACVILDMSMPGLSGLDLQGILAETEGGPFIVFVTGQADIPMTVQAMKAGAMDFLAKPYDPRELLAAVGQAVARHARSRQADAERAELRRRAEALSPREREVMSLVASGLLNKQVGHRLGVSEKTVKAHRAQVMLKMQASSLPDLVRMAEKLGDTPRHPRPVPELQGATPALG
jgi:FixJ family two-component response regulator